MTVVMDQRAVARLKTDVLVVGGGPAGLAAAVTAARQGVKVLLLERYGFCGGAAVAGLSGSICGMYTATEQPTDQPHRLSFGFLDDFIKVMDDRNGLTKPVRYGKTHTLVHEPLAWRETGDNLLEQAGVQVLYHTVVTDVLADGDRIAGVIAYTKQGKLRIEANLTVDASGDGDVCAMAGLATTMGDDGNVQNPTMIFRMTNVNVDAILGAYGEDSIMGEGIMKLIQQLNDSGAYKLPRSKIFLFPTPRANEILCNVTRIVGRDGRELNPIQAIDLTEAEFEGRKQVREYERFIKKYIAGCSKGYVNDTGVQVGVRQTRQIVGMKQLTNEDVVQGRKFADGIARSAWPIELHSGDKPKLVWLFDDYYEVPYSCFVPQKGEAILVAGRCLSAQHEAMASARVTAQCFAYGHAIGHAAALAVKENMAPRDIKGEEIRALLNRDGAQLD